MEKEPLVPFTELKKSARVKLARVARRRSARKQVRTLLGSGIFDEHFYASMTGLEDLTSEQLAEHYLVNRSTLGISPHPLIEINFLPAPVRTATRGNDGIDRLLTYLRSPEARSHAWGPLFDPRVFDEDPLVVLAELPPDRPLPTPRDFLGVAPTFSEACGALLEFSVRYGESPASSPVERQKRDRPDRCDHTPSHGSARELDIINRPGVRDAASQRVSGRTSVVIVVDGRMGNAARSIDRLIDTFQDDLEIIVVDGGSPPAVGRRLTLRYLGLSGVRYVRLPAGGNFALAANYGFAVSTGDQVAFLDSKTDPRDGWLGGLSRARLETGAMGVQSLLVNPDYTVRHAGYAFHGGLPLPSGLVADLTIDDAQFASVNDLTAISGVASLFSAEAFAMLNGFDPTYANGLEDVDFCLRAKRAMPSARFDCVPSTIVVYDGSKPEQNERAHAKNRKTFLARWGKATLPDDGYRYARLALSRDRPTPKADGRPLAAAPMFVTARPRVAKPSNLPSPSLRWAIKTGVPSTRGGDRWGDIPFAADLAAALRALDQRVVTDRYEAWNRSTSYLDDVVLTLRGRHTIPPQPGAVNILWVISRPELVTVDEVRSYDVVFAASEKWAAWMTSRSGRTVETLLQATSAQRFRADLERVSEPDDVIFVGGSHGHEFGRAIVGLALQAGAPVGLWGPGWDKLAPKRNVRGRYLDPDILPNAYRSANIVLNDHFSDMAEWGFINNRTFDAIACGTPVISDRIEGLELFEGSVVIADSVERMRDLVLDRTWMPSTERMRLLSQMIRDHHSFDARARRLLTAAVSIREARASREGDALHR